MAADDSITPSNAPTSSVHAASDGGISANHLQLPRFPARLAPTVEEKFNRLTAGLEAIACWRVDDIRFQFDSSFPGPELDEELTTLASLRAQHTRAATGEATAGAGVQVPPPLSIFGHADPVGDDDYNKQLSGRRALAIYGLLTRDKALWERLYSTRIRNVGDVWGRTSIDTMLDKLGVDGSGDDKGDPVRQFQEENGLGVDGDPGPATRGKLFPAYMDKLCGDLKLDKSDDFLAGTDPDARGDVQGCSEFNPLRLFSKDEMKELAKPENKIKRDQENAPNRRVMVLLFRPGSRVHVEKWPCPKADKDAATCRKRFWSDSKNRLRNDDDRREFDNTADTFACRFYQRIASNSPCEVIIPLVTLRLRIIDDHDIDANGHDNPYDTLSYQLEAGIFTLRGKLPKNGIIERRIPAGTTSGTLKLMQPDADPKAPPFWTLKLAITDTETDSSDIGGAQARLNNLGLLASSTITGEQDDLTRRAIQRFQTRYKVQGSDGKVDTSGDLTQQTAQKLKDVHDAPDAQEQS